MALKSTKESTATMMVAARVACGRLGQPWGQVERGERNADRGEDAGSGGLRASVEIDHRAGEATRDRIAGRNARGDIGRPKPDQFLVGLDALAPLGGQRLCDRDRFHEADQADEKCRRDQDAHEFEVDRRQSDRWQPLRYRADQRHALGTEIEPRDETDRRRDSKDRPRLGDGVGEPGAKADRAQHRLQPFAREPEEGKHTGPHRQGDRVDLPRAPDQAGGDLMQMAIAIRHPEYVTQLARRDQQTGGGDETRDYRMAEEIGYESQPEQAHQHQHGTRQKRQHHRRGQRIGDPLRRNLADRRGRHQRDHSHRSDSQRAAGAEDGIGHQRQDRGIEPDLRRQASQHGIGQRLGHQHDGDDHRRQEIASKASPVHSGVPSRGSAGSVPTRS
jgi:hypothetical protein